MSQTGRAVYSGERIWIIGASSGIGKALALEFAARGANVIASARNQESLQALSSQSECIESMPLDVAEEGALASAVERLKGVRSFPDRILFVAAFYQPSSIDRIESADLHATIRVNLWAVIELARLVMPQFYAQGTGQIALVASVAGYRGLPKGQPYSATKAALINFAESLHLEAKPKGVDVKLINPGFVETPMTDKNNFSMPSLISTEEAAIHVTEGLLARGFEIHFPKRFTRKLKLLRLLPYKIFFKLAENLKPN